MPRLSTLIPEPLQASRIAHKSRRTQGGAAEVSRAAHLLHGCHGTGTGSLAALCAPGRAADSEGGMGLPRSGRAPLGSAERMCKACDLEPGPVPSWLLSGLLPLLPFHPSPAGSPAGPSTAVAFSELRLRGSGGGVTPVSSPGR
nr:uncharacterized protein LOC103218815 [Chlorocebus sabaeus]